MVLGEDPEHTVDYVKVIKKFHVGCKWLENYVGIWTSVT